MVLSPEQRLLVDQRVREQTLGARLPGARSLTAGSADPGSAEGQAVAAFTLDRLTLDDQGSAPVPNSSDQSAAAQTIVDAILGRGDIAPRK